MNNTLPKMLLNATTRWLCDLHTSLIRPRSLYIVQVQCVFMQRCLPLSRYLWEINRSVPPAVIGFTRIGSFFYLFIVAVSALFFACSLLIRFTVGLAVLY